MRTHLVVVGAEPIELGLELLHRCDRWVLGEPALERLVDALDLTTPTSTEWQQWAATNLATFQRGVHEFTAVNRNDRGNGIITQLTTGLGCYLAVTPGWLVLDLEGSQERAR
jgi:hypothetical protein